MTNEITTTSTHDVSNWSMASPEIALASALGDAVKAALQAACKSPHSERAYTTAIGLFMKHLNDERGDKLPVEWQPLAKADEDPKTHKTTWEFRGKAAVLRMVNGRSLDAFRESREMAGDTPNTASIRLAAVRTFLAVALRDGILTNEQAQGMGLKPYHSRQKRIVQPVGRRLEVEEVRALRAAVDTSNAKGKRDLAILDLMLFAGLRREEVANLRLEHFERDGGKWYITFPGKGDYVRKLKVHPVLFDTLTQWFQVAGLELGGNGHIFSSLTKSGKVTGRGIFSNVVGRLVDEYGYKAGLAPLHGNNCLSPHDLRRTCAYNAYNEGKGASLLQVKTMLGHKDIKTTMLYIGADQSNGSSAIDQIAY